MTCQADDIMNQQDPPGGAQALFELWRHGDDEALRAAVSQWAEGQLRAALQTHAAAIVTAQRRVPDLLLLLMKAGKAGRTALVQQSVQYAIDDLTGHCAAMRQRNRAAARTAKNLEDLLTNHGREQVELGITHWLWTHGDERTAVAVAYRWILEHFQGWMLTWAHRHPRQDMDAPEQVQATAAEVALASLGRRPKPGTATPADKGDLEVPWRLWAYLYKGCRQNLRFRVIDEQRPACPTVLELVAGPSPQERTLVALASLRLTCARRWTRARARKLGRYAAAEAALELDAALFGRPRPAPFDLDTHLETLAHQTTSRGRAQTLVTMATHICEHLGLWDEDGRVAYAVRKPCNRAMDALETAQGQPSRQAQALVNLRAELLGCGLELSGPTQGPFGLLQGALDEFGLVQTPAHRAEALLQQPSCASYLRWRLGLERPQDHNRFRQLRRKAEARYQHSQDGCWDELKTLLDKLERSGPLVARRSYTTTPNTAEGTP